MSGSMIPVQPTTSGTQSVVISDADKTDIRHFCGYMAYGAGNAGFQSWRYFSTFGVLEFRLNNLTAAEVASVQAYLGQLRTLRDAIPAAGGQTLLVKQAAVFTRNPDELRERTELFDAWRRRLCGFLGIPPGPDFGGTSATVRLVV